MFNNNYFVYVTTNPGKTVFYVGMANNLERRLIEHRQNKGKPETFAGKYYCYNLVYWERHANVNHAIEREKEIKAMNKEEKLKLIKTLNSKLYFLNIYS
jgi:putative endonuclease